MKLCALLCWWNETHERLHRCVSSLADLVDDLVAFDGAWELMPGGRPHSPDEQARAIQEAADLPGVVFQPRKLWASQEAKRNAALQLGLHRGADWLLVIDADEHVASSSPYFRNSLEHLAGDVAEVMVLDGAARRPRPHRRLYRGTLGMRYEGSHQGIRTRDGRWLHGDTSLPDVHLEPAADLSHLLVLAHEYRDRGEERNAADREYRRRRTAAGLH